MSAQTAAIHPAAVDEKHNIDGVEDIEESSKNGDVRHVIVTEEDVSGFLSIWTLLRTPLSDAHRPSHEFCPARLSGTDYQNIRIRKKTDRYILTLLIWVYFLQIYDKTVFGYGNTYGLSADLGLVKHEYSLLSSMTSIATLAWQPFSAYIIVRVNHRQFMTVCVFCWGTAAGECCYLTFDRDRNLCTACMAACDSFSSIAACRFLLGLFEAANIPLFSMTTATWYRRNEQPLRVCAWFIQNSSATIIAALVSYGL